MQRSSAIGGLVALALGASCVSAGPSFERGFDPGEVRHRSEGLSLELRQVVYLREGLRTRLEVRVSEGGWARLKPEQCVLLFEQLAYLPSRLDPKLPKGEAVELRSRDAPFVWTAEYTLSRPLRSEARLRCVDVERESGPWSSPLLIIPPETQPPSESPDALRPD